MKGRGGLKLADWENGEARLSLPGLPFSNRLNLPSLFSLSIISIHTIPSYNRYSLSSRKVKSTLSVLPVYHLYPHNPLLQQVVSILTKGQIYPLCFPYLSSLSTQSLLTTGSLYPHQGGFNCCSLAAGLRGNGEFERK